MLLSKIETKIRNLKAEYSTNRDVPHQGVKGGLNEVELSGLLKKVIPSKYQISKGLVENSQGHYSREVDLIIYDDEILPPYVKDEYSFVPVEAVKYIFEVKSTLDSGEMKTTIDKFRNFKKIGGAAPAVLFSYSSDIKGSEIGRYYKMDPEFMVNPAVDVICVSDKAYYYKTTEEIYLKNIYKNEEFLKLISRSSKISLDPLDKMGKVMREEAFLNVLSPAQFLLVSEALQQLGEHRRGINDKELVINGVSFNDVKFRIHKWFGVEQQVGVGCNDVEVSLLAGVSNSLSREKFGSYLLRGRDAVHKIYSVCHEDMWGNLSFSDFDEAGLAYDVSVFKMSYTSGSEAGSHKIIFNRPES